MRLESPPSGNSPHRSTITLMAHELTTSYLRDSIALFRHYKKLGEGAIAQCPDEALFVTLDHESNSIAIIVNRDGEFEDAAKTRAELLAVWDAGWKIFLDTLESLRDTDMNTTVTIRAEPHSVMQAINRQLAHYPMHLGQIVLLAKHYAGDNWKTLSVPLKASAQFTAEVAASRKSQR